MERTLHIVPFYEEEKRMLDALHAHRLHGKMMISPEGTLDTY